MQSIFCFQLIPQENRQQALALACMLPVPEDPAAKVVSDTVALQNPSPATTLSSTASYVVLGSSESRFLLQLPTHTVSDTKPMGLASWDVQAVPFL